jgi:hypothetical protein
MQARDLHAKDVRARARLRARALVFFCVAYDGILPETLVILVEA